MKLLSSIQGVILVVAVTATLLGAAAAQGPTPYKSVRYSSPTELPLGEVKLPPGFHIHLYVNESVPNARTMVRSEVSNSTAAIIYVSSQSNGTVHAIVDYGSDGHAEKVCTVLSGLNVPEGLLWANGSLYVFDTTTLRRFDDIDAAVLNGCQTVPLSSGKVILNWFPKETFHASRNMVLGPDGYLYVVVGSPANVADCEKVNPYGVQLCSIVRMRLDGSGLQTFASGVRNVVGLDLDSSGKNLYFVQLGRDNLGEDQPDDVLRSAPLAAASPADFNFPFCHWVGSGPPSIRNLGPGKPFPDDQKVAPAVQASVSSENATTRAEALTGYCKATSAPPVQSLGPHVAGLGITFAANNTSFPPQYSGNGTLFIAEHGSYDRKEALGYRVALVQLDAAGKPVRHEVFASGWLRNANTTKQEYWGRPTNLLFLPDSSLLLSDDFAGAVYRITYTG